ncbi:MAG: hypothetical protein WKF73_14230 [Nocardioidaceae bacterium]
MSFTLDSTDPLRGLAGPLSLLGACLLPVAGAFAIHTAAAGLWGVGAELVALGWLARNPRGSLRLLAFGVLAAVSIAASTYLYGGRHVDESAAAALRISYLVLPAALLTPLIRPAELGDHLAQRLHLARSAGRRCRGGAAAHRVDRGAMAPGPASSQSPRAGPRRWRRAAVEGVCLDRVRRAGRVDASYRLDGGGHGRARFRGGDHAHLGRAGTVALG